jgi:hypothetical protein
MEVYRRHYRNPGLLRQPMLTWSRELPIGGEPEDVTQIVDSYSRWLATSLIPKLLINGDAVNHHRGPTPRREVFPFVSLFESFSPVLTAFRRLTFVAFGVRELPRRRISVVGLSYHLRSATRSLREVRAN